MNWFTISTTSIGGNMSEKDLKLSESETSNFRRGEKIVVPLRKLCLNMSQCSLHQLEHKPGKICRRPENSTTLRGRTAAYPATAAWKLRNFRKRIWRPHSKHSEGYQKQRPRKCLPARLSKDFSRKWTWASMNGRRHAARPQSACKRCSN